MCMQSQDLSSPLQVWSMERIGKIQPVKLNDECSYVAKICSIIILSHTILQFECIFPSNFYFLYEMISGTCYNSVRS